MALDRFIRFTKEAPNPEELVAVLRRYVYGVGVVEPGIGDFSWVALVRFPGIPFHIFSPQTDEFQTLREQYFEVWRHPQSVDVLTRMQGEFVNAIAQGFAEAVARYWNGTVDPN